MIVEALVQLGQGRAASGRGVVLAVDGRSSSGKTTLAARLQDAVRGSAVVHIDDIAWWHSRFGWADLLINGLLVPFHRGELVNFRPPGWAGHGREGSIEVAARCPLLTVEGVGAGRSEVSHLVDVLVWVQADQLEAERRSLARVGQPGGARTIGDYREWMAEEEPFLIGRRPWDPRGRAGGRYSRDPFRPSDRTCRRAAAQPVAATAKGRSLSQLSRGLTGRHGLRRLCRTSGRTLACRYGFRRTAPDMLH